MPHVRSIAGQPASRALALLAACLALAALAFSGTARAVVPADPGGSQPQVEDRSITLLVCKVIEGLDRIDPDNPYKFEIKVGSTAWYPVISKPGTDGEQCEKFIFDQPEKVTIAEADPAPFQAFYTIQPAFGSAIGPDPLPKDGILLYLLHGACGLEEPKAQQPTDGVDCTVTITNRAGSAQQLEAFTFTKRAVQPVVTDPADIEFEITVASTYTTRTPDSLHFNFYDPGVVVSGGPVAVKASCGSPGYEASNLQAGLGSFDPDAYWGFECKSITDDVNGLSITFRVRPATLPERTCEDQVVSNAAKVLLWAKTNPYSTVPEVKVILESSASVTLKGDPARCPLTIQVLKTLNIVGFEAPGPGWEFTLEGCGIGPVTAVTGANGIAEFPGLPPAENCSYTVTETLQPGWTPVVVSQSLQPTVGGQVYTVEFLNIRDYNPPCVDPADPRCALELEPTEPPAPPAPPE
uniref:hypothetical protein n=1 Tax=Tepidiforma sp. TaxID=2682230 RepID=UPI002ADE0683